MLNNLFVAIAIITTSSRGAYADKTPPEGPVPEKPSGGKEINKEPEAKPSERPGENREVNTDHPGVNTDRPAK